MDIDFTHLTQEQKNAQLFAEAEKGRTEELAKLINQGADIHAKTNRGDTALMGAAYNGHIAIVEFLIEKGADIHAQNNEGKTALMLAQHNLCKKEKEANQLTEQKRPILNFRRGGGLMFAHNIIYIPWGPDRDMLAEIKNHRAIAFRLLCAMTPRERDVFSHIKQDNFNLVNEFKQSLKDNANRIYDIVMPCIKVLPGSIFEVMLEDLAKSLLKLQVLCISDFPKWYQHRVKEDLILTLKFKQDKKVPVLIFSQPEIVNSNKRKAEDDLEKEGETKKVRITSSEQSDDSSDSEEDMRPEPNSSCRIS